MSGNPHALQEHNGGAQPTWREALKFWFWLGCMSFGGPAGQIALMHEELVVRRRWISEKRYLHALHYCMLLPGPEAQQLATYTGWLMYGPRGGIAAGALFVLPSLVLLMVLSWTYTAWGQHPWGQALLWGLKPAVTALVLQAAHRLALRTLKARWLWALAALSLLGMLWGLPFALIIGLAAATGYHMSRQTTGTTSAHPTPAPVPEQGAAQTTPHTTAWLDDDTPTPSHTHYSHARLVRALSLGVGLWALSMGLIALVFGLGHTLTHMGGFFTQAALLTFGGAYAVLPFVTQAAVVHYGWLSAAQMMDGLALGESTPGPLIMVVAFVGFLGGHSQALFGHPVLGGIVAACVVTWFTFLPSFVFILAGGPLVESTRQMPSLAGPLQGIMAAVIGVIVHLAGVFARQTWLPGGWHMLPDLGAIALTVLATWLLIRQQLSVFKLLGLCTALGLVWQLVV
ncbi:chromate efflux transporter [Limnohabitans sp. Bal53]|uniref:chromate efflux transporter n=1 Tax=Limnohabitans sp. Bal53 TaxID=1977910 RepID=UPI000D39A762|nr:chromate efflux transporter [Limnohabitans sp. Bal53]PUE41130.1 chromate transporter [Limnohabitans sp. Bal53]